MGLNKEDYGIATCVATVLYRIPLWPGLERLNIAYVTGVQKRAMLFRSPRTPRNASF